MARTFPAAQLLLAAMLAAGPGGQSRAAQQAAPQPRPEEPGTAEAAPRAEPAAVPVSDVPRELETSLLRVREINASLTPDARVVEITDKLEGNGKELDSLRRSTDSSVAAAATLRAIQDLRQQWMLRRVGLDNWAGALKKRSEALEEQKQDLRRLRARWERTRDALGRQEVPPALRERVHELLAQIGGVESELQNRLDAVLTLQNVVAGQRIRCDEAISSLDAADERRRSNLLTPDGAPLWRELFSPTAEKQLGKQLADAWTKDRMALAEVYDTYRVTFKAQLLGFLALVLLTVLLRRRAVAWAGEEEALEFSAHALRRPLSAALLLTLIASYFLYPRAPIVFYELNTLLLMLPVLRLLPGLVSAPMRGPLYGLIGLFVADQVHELAVEGTLLHRVLLLLLSAASLAGLIWVLRPGGPASRARGGRWWNLATSVARAGYLTLGAAIPLNLIGNVSLAGLLANGTLSSARFGVILYAATLVVDGLVAVGLRTRPARSLNAVRRHGDLIKRRGFALSHILAASLWVYAVLSVFNVRDIVVGEATAIFKQPWRVGTVQVSLSGVLGFFLAIYIAYQLSRLIRFLLEEDVLPRLTLPRGVPNAVSSLTHYVILGAGFVLALGAAGFELTRFTVIAGAFGVGIGFGLQNVVNNFISGLILMFERPVQVGDTIEVGQMLGTVRRIGIRASTIRTFEGAEVIIPNGNLISAEVVNWTLSDRMRRIDVRVGVAYGSDPGRVLELLAETARAQTDVLDYPQPFALFLGFGDSSLDFELRFWTSNFDNWRRIASQVTVAVHDAIVGAGIVIPFPQRDLHVRSIDPGAGAAVRDRIRTGGSAPTDEPSDREPAAPQDEPPPRARR